MLFVRVFFLKSSSLAISFVMLLSPEALMRAMIRPSEVQADLMCFDSRAFDKSSCFFDCQVFSDDYS